MTDVGQAISAALWHRRSGGGGQHVEVCLFDTALNMLLNYGAMYLLTGDNPSRVGNGTPVAKPSRVYQAKDGGLMITIGSDRLFRSLCGALKRPDLAVHPDDCAYLPPQPPLQWERRGSDNIPSKSCVRSVDWMPTALPNSRPRVRSYVTLGANRRGGGAGRESSQVDTNRRTR